MIAAAGVWAGLLIVVRLFDRPLGQNLLALVCAAVLAFAGVLERAKRPADDLPAEPQPRPERRPRDRRPAPAGAPESDAEAPTEPLPPPEFKPYEPEPGQQLRLGGEDTEPQPPPGDA